MKLYIVEVGRFGDDISGMLLTADGDPIYQHVSSSRSWLELDLTRNFGRDKELAERFGEFELVYVAGGEKIPDEIAEHFRVEKNLSGGDS